MRLTLRTMLAYLDEILEPDDAEDIGKKIEESEFAKGLMHRTSDCVKRLRLGAPPLLGRGIALDPNTVAEYLDNTLASERVPDFEKVCLESDVHLAEVASCHQILTLVLGEPAEIEPSSRERMYKLASEAPPVEAPPVAAASVQTPSVTTPLVDSPAAVVEAQKRSKPEVPDYLRESRSRLWPVAVTVLIAALLTMGGLFAFGPPGVKQYVASLFASSQNTPEPTQEPEGSGASDNAKQPGAESENPESEPDASTKTNGKPDASEAENRTEPSAPGTDTVGRSPKGNLEFPRPSRPGTEENPAPPAPEPSEKPLAPTLPPATPPGTASSATGPAGAVPPATVVGPAVTPGTPAANPPLVGVPVAPTAGPVAPPASPTIAKPPAPEDLAAAMGIGRYLSAQDVLLRVDRAENAWRRMPAKANVAAGDILLALPTFSPTVTLANGAVVQLIGPTLVELQGLDERGVPGIIIDYGRVTMMTVNKTGCQIRVVLGDKTGLASLGDAEASLAIEVRRVLPLGKDPEAGPAPLGAELYATSGQILWADAMGEQAIKAPGRRVLAAGAPLDLVAEGDLPKWVSGDQLSDLDKRASPIIEHDLSTDRPVSLGMKELTESRRFEVRTLAIRSSAFIGFFDPYVAALNDPDQRSNWTMHIDALRTAMASSPEVSAQVRATFEKQRAEDGKALYRMLWGHTAEDLPSVGPLLVRDLDHESLDFRVLSFWNLQNMTGLSFAYRPAEPPVKRRPSVIKWKEKVAEGKFAPAAPAGAKPAPAPTPAVAPPAGAIPPAAPAAGAPAPAPAPATAKPPVGVDT